MADDYTKTNVEAQQDDPASMLSYRPLEAGNDQVIAYLREDEVSRILVALNFAVDGLKLGLPLNGAEGEFLCSTYPNRTGSADPRRLELGPYEGVIVQLG